MNSNGVLLDWQERRNQRTARRPKLQKLLRQESSIEKSDCANDTWKRFVSSLPISPQMSVVQLARYQKACLSLHYQLLQKQTR